MGGRLLRRWVAFPLKDERAIAERLDVVDSFFRDPDLRELLDEFPSDGRPGAYHQ